MMNSTDDPCIKLVVAGSKGVGKSSMLQSLHFDHQNSPSKFIIARKAYDINGVKIQVDFFESRCIDAEEFIDTKQVKNAQAFLIVYSVDNPESFQFAAALLDEIKNGRSDSHSVPIVIVGNKADLVEDMKVSDCQVGELLLSVSSMTVTHMTASVKTAYHVIEVFEELVHLSRILEMQMGHNAVARRLSSLSSWDSGDSCWTPPRSPLLGQPSIRKASTPAAASLSLAPVGRSPSVRRKTTLGSVGEAQDRVQQCYIQ